MLANFLFSLNVVVPVFVVMILGYILKKTGVISAGFLESGNKIVYYIGLPAQLFRAVYTTDIREYMDLRFTLFALIATAASFFIIWGGAAIFFKKDPPVLGAFAQGAFRGSFALLGIPLIINMAGDAGMARAALVVMFVVPFFNVFSVMSLASCSGKKPGVLTVILTVVKNPSNIMIAIGMVLSMFDLPLPEMIGGGINITANIATPLALICLGGGMAFRGFDAKFKYAVIASVIKCVIIPIAFTVAAFLMGFRDYDLAVILIMGGIPSAVVAYAMAVQFGGDTYVAGTIVVITTFMSAVTLTIFIYAVRALGWVVI